MWCKVGIMKMPLIKVVLIAVTWQAVDSAHQMHVGGSGWALRFNGLDADASVVTPSVTCPEGATRQI